MTIVIHTDASTKNGYSCWAYKSSHQDKFKAGLLKTMNSAAVETLAVVKAIQHAPQTEKLLIISDSLVTVKLIQQYHVLRYKKFYEQTIYHKIKNQLLSILRNRVVEAVWICSNNSNSTHLAVDHIAKTILNNYLQGRQ